MNGADSEILLSNPNRAPTTSNETACWEIPEEIRATPPDVLWQASPVMRGDDLCLYCNVRDATHDGFQACLYYFAKGQKSGLKIPLKFQSQGAQNQKLTRMQSVIYNYQSLQATDYGLIIVQTFGVGGFWVVPWREIDAYRAQFAGGSVQTAANPVATAPAPAAAPTAVAPPAPVSPPPPSSPVTPPVTPVPVTPSDPSGP